MSKKQTHAVPTRIHVGSISAELASNINELETRFAKYGQIITPFTIHQKDNVDYHYGYVTILLTPESFKKLSKTFNGVNYKGSKLRINQAKPDYKERWLKDSKRQDTKIKQRALRSKIAQVRDERIANKDANPFELDKIIPGRLRKNARKDTRKLTLRVHYKDTIKVIKCKKTKVWGYNKAKKLRDMTYRFVNNLWMDGNDHIIDRLATNTLIFTEKGIQIEKQDPALLTQEVEDNEEVAVEKDMNNKLLESFLTKFNFEKPVELQTREEADADSDYEFEGKLREINSEDEDEDDDQVIDIHYKVPEKDCIKPSNESIIEANEDEAKTSVEQEEEEEEEEFIPTFGKTNSTQSASTNETEALRSLLNPTTSTSFKLVNDEDEDIDQTKTLEVESAPSLTVNSTAAIIPVLKERDLGLFFPHFESPFLNTQTQLNKLQTFKIQDKLQYDEWFFSNRGELNREFRARKRDFHRGSKKRGKVTLI
ncbi:hypothetical protein CANARDRAFT_235904 [[Candida] arabinofermentans NRRL YB-2248]|uniref:RRM domain-containing protein n=1 Tax=[Candida] arabinofermentans NRRL YB-2248 TaxID=983967 RepID=A0A1E4SYN3_9ASCO|nr:hypothetical protein CANARDRAFT_235904 [[Candida] arabinofermentans NRRL YB-2248]